MFLVSYLIQVILVPKNTGDKFALKNQGLILVQFNLCSEGEFGYSLWLFEGVDASYLNGVKFLELKVYCEVLLKLSLWLLSQVSHLLPY